MATMTYQQWLAARTRRAGHTVISSPTEAAAFRNWQSQQPEYKAQQQLNQQLYSDSPPDPAAGGQSTAVDPNDLWNAILKDPTAINDTGLARQDYTVGGANALAQWQNQRNQLAAQLPQYALEQEQGLRQAASNTAARGTAQSGQGELEKQQSRTNYANEVAQNQLQAQAADTNYQTQASGLASDFNNRYYGAFKDAANRYMTNRLSDFSNTYGIGSGLGAQVPTTQAAQRQVSPVSVTPPPPTLGPTPVTKPKLPVQRTQVRQGVTQSANMITSAAKRLTRRFA